MYFSITGVKKIIIFIKDFVLEVCYIKVPLYQVSSLNVFSVSTYYMYFSTCKNDQVFQWLEHRHTI